MQNENLDLNNAPQQEVTKIEGLNTVEDIKTFLHEAYKNNGRNVYEATLARVVHEIPQSELLEAGKAVTDSEFQVAILRKIDLDKDTIPVLINILRGASWGWDEDVREAARQRLYELDLNHDTNFKETMINLTEEENAHNKETLNTAQAIVKADKFIGEYSKKKVSEDENSRLGEMVKNS